MNSEKIMEIGFYLVLGAFAYHLYQKKRGVLKTHDNIEDRLDDSRVTLHKFIDDLMEGTASDKEIEEAVYKIIP